MYYLLSLLAGTLIAVMVACNGGLAAHAGLYPSVVLIHLTGLFVISLLLVIRREGPFTSRQTWYLYLGGAIGVMTIAFNNFAFGQISVSALLALSLLGESVTGLIVDQFGLLGMQKHPFDKWKAAGLLLITGGIAVMIDHFVLLPVLVSFVCGVNVVISRTLNARLAGRTSIRVSTFYNYLIGLGVSVPVYLLLGDGALAGFTFSPDWTIYLGGGLGVCVVLISNFCVMKLPSFYLSLFLFTGMVFTSVIIDTLLSQSFSPRTLAGGVLVAAGLSVNLLLDRRGKKRRPA